MEIVMGLFAVLFCSELMRIIYHNEQQDFDKQTAEYAEIAVAMQNLHKDI